MSSELLILSWKTNWYEEHNYEEQYLRKELKRGTILITKESKDVTSKTTRLLLTRLSLMVPR